MIWSTTSILTKCWAFIIFVAIAIFLNTSCGAQDREYMSKRIPGRAASKGEPGAKGQDGKNGEAGIDGSNGADGQDCQSSYVSGGVVVQCGDYQHIVHHGHQGPRGPQGQPGEAGAMGEAGEDGNDGLDGSSCTVEQTEEGAVISCTDGTSAVIAAPEKEKHHNCKKKGWDHD